MPQSADQVSAAKPNVSYLAAWQAIERFLRQGRPFSGHERHCSFLNTGGRRFANASAVTGLDFADDGRGLALTDWDHDGDLDVWIANRTGPRLRVMRNECPARDQFVAFRLQGTTCNRDAIGGRVEVRVADPGNKNGRLVQTLYAGDAYLSQSSKWLHFGLGPVASLREVVVRWPDNKLESFSGAEPGGRYLLKQGAGVVEPRQRRARTVQLEPSVLPPFKSREAARVVFSQPIPLPLLAYERLSNNQRSAVAQLGGKPQLVNLWASWCRPCLKELRGWAQDEAQLHRAGVEILALSVDVAADQTEGSRQATQDVLRKTGFTQAAGFATPEMLDKLQRLFDVLFATHVPLAVPTSFLLDGEGRLTVIYRGPVRVDQLLEDVQLTSASPAERRDQAAPFGGRWYTKPGRFQLDQLAAAFGDAYPDDAERYLMLALQESQPDSGNERVRDERVRIHLRSAHLAHRQGRFEDAVAHAQRARRLRRRDAFCGRSAARPGSQGRNHRHVPATAPSRSRSGPDALQSGRPAGSSPTDGRSRRATSSRVRHKRTLCPSPSRSGTIVGRPTQV